MKVRVIDCATGEKKIVNIATPQQTRVMKRAITLFHNAKKMGLTDVFFSFYLKYSWELEKGHVIA